MNRGLRLELLKDWTENDESMVIDFTRFDLPAKEPAAPELGKHARNWSLMNRTNQKGIRPQDQPVPLVELTIEEQSLIEKHYPKLFAPESKWK
jgi:hypothetical protein